jgi:hypothetical protein
LLPAGPRSRIGTAFANAGGITIRPAFLTPQLFARAGLSKEPVARHPQKLRMLLIYQIFFQAITLLQRTVKEPWELRRRSHV